MKELVFCVTRGLSMMRDCGVVVMVAAAAVLVPPRLYPTAHLLCLFGTWIC